MTPKQEDALLDYLQEVITPLIEQVLVKKLGQAMTFAKEEIIKPKLVEPRAMQSLDSTDRSQTQGGEHMRDTIDMAREVYGAHTEWSGAPLDRLEQLVALVRADECEKSKHNEEVLMNALWKACGDDAQVVVETIESQGELK